MIYAQVSGFRAFDTLTAGSAGSVTAPSVAFGEAEAMGNFYVCGAEDGVCCRELPACNDYLDCMQRLLKLHAMSIWLHATTI